MSFQLPAALRQTLYYGLGIVLMKGVSLFMVPYLAHKIEPADFGRLEILVTLATFASVLVGFGLVDALFRFVGETVNWKARRQVGAEIFGLALVVGLMALVIGIAVAPIFTVWLPGSVQVDEVRLVLITLALEGCIAIPLSWLRLCDKAKQFFIISTSKALLQATLVILFLEAGYGVYGILLAGLLAATAQALVLAVIQLRMTGVVLRVEKIRVLMLYGAPLIATGMVSFAINGFDRWLLADGIGEAELAYYAVAAKFALAAALLLQPYGMWWFSRRFLVLNNPDGVEQAAHYAALGVVLALFILVAIGVGSPVLILLLLPIEYHQAMFLAPWLVLSITIKDSADLLNLGCYTGRTTGTQFGVNLAGSLVGVLLMLVAIPVWGAAGAVAGLILAQSTRLMLFLYFSQRVLYLPYPALKLISLAGLALLLLVLGNQINDLLHRVIMVSISLLLMFAVSYRFNLLPWKKPSKTKEPAMSCIV